MIKQKVINFLPFILTLCDSTSYSYPKICKESETFAIPQRSVPGMRFNLTGTQSCSETVDPTLLVLGNEWPIQCLPTFECTMPADAAKGLQPIRMDNKTIASVVVVPGPAFALNTHYAIDLDNPDIIIEMFPPFEPEWLPEVQRSVRVAVFDRECSTISFSHLEIKCSEFTDTSESASSDTLFIVVFVLCLMMYLALACLLLYLFNPDFLKRSKNKHLNKNSVANLRIENCSQLICSIDLYCSRMILRTTPEQSNLHVYLEKEKNGKDLNDELVAVKELFKEVVFIGAVRDICDNATIDPEVSQELAIITLLLHENRMERFTEILVYMFEAEAKKLKYLTNEDLNSTKYCRKTTFLIYIASYWLSLTIHRDLENSKALQHLYNIYAILAHIHDMSFNDENLGIGQYMVARIELPFELRRMKLKKEDEVKTSVKRKKKRKNRVKYNTGDSLDTLRKRIMDERYCRYPALQLPKKAHVMVESRGVKFDAENLVSKSTLTLENCRIPPEAKGWLSSSNSKQDIEPKDFSILKLIGKTPESNGLSCSQLIRPYPERYVKSNYELKENDDRFCKFTRNAIKSDLNSFLDQIQEWELHNENMKFIVGCIDWACSQAGAPPHVNNYLKKQILVRHFWAHMMRDVSRVFDLNYSHDLPGVVRRNMELIADMMDNEREPKCARINDLFNRTKFVNFYKSQKMSDSASPPSCPSGDALEFTHVVKNERRILKDALIFIQRTQDDLENIFEDLELDEDDENVYNLLLTLFKEPKKMKKDKKKKKNRKKNKKKKKSKSKKSKRKSKRSSKKSKHKSKKSRGTAADEDEEDEESTEKKSKKHKKRKSKSSKSRSHVSSEMDEEGSEKKHKKHGKKSEDTTEVFEEFEDGSQMGSDSREKKKRSKHKRKSSVSFVQSEDDSDSKSIKSKKHKSDSKADGSKKSHKRKSSASKSRKHSSSGKSGKKSRSGKSGKKSSSGKSKKKSSSSKSREKSSSSKSREKSSSSNSREKSSSSKSKKKSSSSKHKSKSDKISEEESENSS